jgi:hypothetical protein
MTKKTGVIEICAARGIQEEEGGIVYAQLHYRRHQRWSEVLSTVTRKLDAHSDGVQWPQASGRRAMLDLSGLKAVRISVYYGAQRKLIGRFEWRDLKRSKSDGSPHWQTLSVADGAAVGAQVQFVYKVAESEKKPASNEKDAVDEADALFGGARSRSSGSLPSSTSPASLSASPSPSFQLSSSSRTPSPVPVAAAASSSGIGSNSLSPPKKEAGIRRHFVQLDGEPLRAHFGAMLNDDVMRRPGTLAVLGDSICFAGALFGKVIKVHVPFDQVAAIQIQKSKRHRRHRVRISTVGADVHRFLIIKDDPYAVIESLSKLWQQNDSSSRRVSTSLSSLVFAGDSDSDSDDGDTSRFDSSDDDSKTYGDSDDDVSEKCHQDDDDDDEDGGGGGDDDDDDVMLSRNSATNDELMMSCEPAISVDVPLCCETVLSGMLSNEARRFEVERRRQSLGVTGVTINRWQQVADLGMTRRVGYTRDGKRMIGGSKARGRPTSYQVVERYEQDGSGRRLTFTGAWTQLNNSPHSQNFYILGRFDLVDYVDRPTTAHVNVRIRAIAQSHRATRRDSRKYSKRAVAYVRTEFDQLIASMRAGHFERVAAAIASDRGAPKQVKQKRQQEGVVAQQQQEQEQEQQQQAWWQSPLLSVFVMQVIIIVYLLSKIAIVEEQVNELRATTLDLFDYLHDAGLLKRGEE